jgi:YidC/Oxa1 family membrane protein insertase
VLFSDVPVIQPLINFFEWFLLRFHDFGLGWGLSIIALTILVRACLLPLTFKQYHSMQRLAHLQPEMKKLQERFKSDKERLNQEMMKFYRENKVNPFASCLPMVAQFPVFISLYYMLRVDLRYDICPDVNPVSSNSPQPCGSTPASQFLFIDDLTSKATGATLVILIVLYVGSQLFSTLLMSTTTDKTQRMIFLALPFIFVTFVIQFPAGLLVYWITTNVWTIVQQAIIRKRLGPLRPVTADSGGGGGLFGGSGGLFGGGGGGSSGGNGPKSGGGGGGDKPSARVKEPAGVSAEPKGRPSGPPPPSPRKKKKRSGRRR